MSDLLALADRVEALTGPCRETDAQIALAFNLYDRPEDLGCFVDLAEAVVGGGGQTWAPPAYTASIDAAMALVPERSWTRLDVWTKDLGGCTASVYLIGRDIEGGFSAHAATPATALAAAALRARAAQVPA